MSEKMYEALEVCLQALETGADLEAALKRFPDVADEIRPLLEASTGARSLASADIPVEAMQRGRARVLGHAAEMREAGGGLRWPVIPFRRFAVALALALVVFLSGTGLVRASNGALPGDDLYPVKRAWEDVRLILVVDQESREGLEGEFEHERLEEVDELLREGRHETISFAGIVTQQDGDLWLVSGIPVQIVAASQLPAEPVGVGAAVTVDGHTNLDGFVEAERIELIESVGFLSPMEPVEIENELEAEGDERYEGEAEEGGEVEESELKDDSLSGKDYEDRSGESESDESDNSGSGSNDNGGEEEEESDHSGSGSNDNDHEEEEKEEEKEKDD